MTTANVQLLKEVGADASLKNCGRDFATPFNDHRSNQQFTTK